MWDVPAEVRQIKGDKRMAEQQKKTAQQVADEITELLNSSELPADERKEAVKIVAKKEGIVPSP